MATKPKTKARPTQKKENLLQAKSAPSSSRKNILSDPFYIAGAVAVLLLGGILLFFSRNLFFAATVNGHPISKAQLNQELERQAGKQVINSLVTKELILQEAAKQKVSVSNSEIDSEIKKIESNFAKQGQKLEDVMKAQGVTMSTLRDQIKIQKLVEKMVGKGISVNDKEVTDYMEANKDKFNGQVDKEQIKQQLLQQKINNKIPAWVEELQKNAKITFYL